MHETAHTNSFIGMVFCRTIQRAAGPRTAGSRVWHDARGQYKYLTVTLTQGDQDMATTGAAAGREMTVKLSVC